MITASLIHDSLSTVGLKEDDIVMIHADAGVAAQLTGVPSAERLKLFINSIVAFFEKGTIVVPTFSYSLTKGNIFDKDNTPSDVGQFSENFRRYDGVARSCHPIFSVAVHGKEKEKFINTKLTDCFGEGTVFDELYKHDAKILCLGCSLDRVTFVHYVEQHLNVQYRYFKTFSGDVICNSLRSKVETQYFVRDLEVVTSCDLTLLKEKTLANGLLKQTSLGRFSLLCISAKSFFDTASELIETNPLALIKQKIDT